ncbi:uncharacterized protein GGS22DRAFT_111215 [Annulohypoxylon maeteangense]|uniref:uncharacterized protein n=1 Tax=Annulohypoxylon maeteangense TaxID=1927788 RepID=UPI002008AB91|nr:uncharacterized protein GGS22DRAFT_111215 [Annulohypoxylon maeteangense]KAI0887554.1 hypothetical protein GGS22DRAFT_111215 [Annulohypoxylon maeteangense]
MVDNLYLPADPELGLRHIHQACLRGDFEAVVKLSCQPGIIDVPTEPRNGVERGLRETPIKLAALMGHVDIVWFLVEQGAALTHDRVLASSYTADEGLATRRRDFFLNTVGIGREHPDSTNTRKTIFDILSSPGRRSVVRATRGARSDLGFPDYKLAKQGRDIVVFAPVLRIRSDIPLDRSKTIGIITSKASSGDILMSAHSGFRAGTDRHERSLDTNQWNYIALHHIAKLLKFHFPGNKHDNGAKKASEDEHRGRAHAGHVEVLLGAWYAVEMTKKQEMAKNGGEDVSLEWCLNNLHTLKYATIGQARSAVIMIDSQPCATCLKFINYLFQYTGLHFSVKGAVGVGPTLATKDERNGVRMDTFGDVFLEDDIDGAEDYEESTDIDSDVDTVLETPIGLGVPGGIRETIEGNEGKEEDGMAAHAQAQAASEAFARISSLSPSDMDTENVPMTTPAPEPVTPQRAAPFTPARSRMRWGVPDSGPRSIKRGDPFSNIPSRRPANPDELVAEYKKKTPVWNWPGYNPAGMTPFCRPPFFRHANLGSPLALPSNHTLIPGVNTNNDKNDGSAMAMNEGSVGEGSGEGDDPIIVDMMNGNVSYSSPPSSSIIRESIAAFNARISNHYEGTPSPLGREQTNFSHSSFQPIANQSREKANNLAKDKNMVIGEPQFQHQSQTHVNPMYPNHQEDEEGYIHVQPPLPSHIVSQLSHAMSQNLPQPQPMSEPTQPPSEPPFLSQTGSRYYAAALLMGAQSPDPTPCPIPAAATAAAGRAQTPLSTTGASTAMLSPPITPMTIPPSNTPRPAPRPPNFQQWRFEPQLGGEEVSRHFCRPRLHWQQQGPVAFPEVVEGGAEPERGRGLRRRG